MRGCLRTLLVLLLIAVVLLGAAYVLLTRPPALAAGVTPVPVSTAAAQSFDRKFESVQRATTPTTVEITDQEATSKLVAALAANPDAPRIDGAQVAFRDGKVYFSGTTRDTPIPVRVVVVSRVEARDGRLVPTVEQIDTGRFPAPAPLRDQIVRATTNFDALSDDLPIYVNDVHVLDGRLALTGRAK